LAETRPWVMTLSVAGYIAAAMFIVPALYTCFFGGPVATRDVGRDIGNMTFGFVAGALCLAPATWLMQFASDINDLQQSKKMRHLKAALAAQKSFWKFCGICTLIYLALFAIGLLFALMSRGIVH